MRNLLIMIALLSVAACGFRPVYGVNRDTPVGVETQLDKVYVENIPDREGQYLRNALIDRFYRSGRPSDPVYTLSMTPVSETLTELDITKTSDATRGQLRLDTNLRLIERASGKIVLERRLASITSYNILGSEFASRVTEDNARTNALDDLARQAEMQLSLYFKRQ
jgi:LPS-assembly lipoprotein